MGNCYTKNTIEHEIIPRVSIKFTPVDAIIFVLARNKDITLTQILTIIENTGMWDNPNPVEAQKAMKHLIKVKQVNCFWDEEIGQNLYKINVEKLI